MNFLSDISKPDARTFYICCGGVSAGCFLLSWFQIAREKSLPIENVQNPSHMGDLPVIHIRVASSVTFFLTVHCILNAILVNSNGSLCVACLIVSDALMDIAKELGAIIEYQCFFFSILVE